MAKPAEKCQQSGTCQGNCANALQIAFSKGDVFPPRRNHGSVTWTLVWATQN